MLIYYLLSQILRDTDNIWQHKARNILQGHSVPRRGEKISCLRNKFIRFILTTRSTHGPGPTFPVFPLTLDTCLEYFTWLYHHNVQNPGSAAVYVHTACMWARELGHNNPISESPTTEALYAKFKDNFAKIMPNVRRRAPKTPIQPSMMAALATLYDSSSFATVVSLAAYNVLWYAAVRCSHIAPKKTTDLAHVITWGAVIFLPSVRTPHQVFIRFASSKTRPEATNAPFWAVLDRREGHPGLCPVTLMHRLYCMTSNTHEHSPVFRQSQHSVHPLSRSAFTNKLRLDFAKVAKHLVLPPNFTASMLSAVSFRKGSCTALAPRVNAQQLMLHADHATIESTFQYYRGSFEDRKLNTQRLSAEFPRGF